MIQIVAYLNFNGNCREAMTFYQRCFGGTLEMVAVKDSPDARKWPKKVQNDILHAGLISDDFTLLASDMAGDDAGWGSAITLSFMCTTEDEITSAFSRLSEGATVSHPLHKFFSGTIGSLTDRYGIHWIFKL
ncbi:VOC family protein [Hufsiella ginkgonis]|uniref:VOC family protein n=1 Tax=Hufsiella ginkgonis TaxID=2695274 RepID=A0A7K1XVR0_9SPHI|nr:VOC family protein [Hufsiella ginkgonis]MXV15085.1 VOC family protein [Hufsiella ginkgonis]